MKKTLIIAGILGAFAAAGSAQAQSSVTLYGSLDAGLVYVNNVAGGHGYWGVDSGALSPTYFGLRGNEDLGYGTSAFFDLEEGFNLNNGQASAGNWLTGAQGMWTRYAYVGLKNNQFGSLSFGKQSDEVEDYLGPLALAGQAGGINLAGHPFNNDNVMSLYTYDNTVKYASPKWSGPWGAFDFGATYSFSNSTDFIANRAYSVGAGYSWGPLKFGAAYNQINSDKYNWGGVGTGGAAALNYDPTTGTVTGGAPGVFGADVQRTFGVGANYGFNLGGHAGSVGVLWTQTNLQGVNDLAAPAGLGHNRFDNIEINGTYMITPALAAVANYTYTWTKGLARPTATGAEGSSAKFHSVTLGLDYGLSKRTDVYLAGVYQHASGNVADGTDGSYYNPAGISVIPAADAANQVGAAIGIRHRF